MSLSVSPSDPLCLACSGCIAPPVRPHVFLTRCCARPICPSCLRANPRLARYGPCLLCLAGVRAAAAASTGTPAVNIDGSLRDEHVFVVGDDDDDLPLSSPPPAYREADADADPASPAPSTSDLSCTPGGHVHYIHKADTLRGLALRYGVDGRALCRLNGLPPSTLSTTPHLLHTRATLVLPPSARPPKPADASTVPDEDDDTDTPERALERATTRLQLVTKEADRHVARAYVALASDPCTDGRVDEKCPATGEKHASADSPRDTAAPTVTARAVDAYLDDDAWEAGERAAGRGPSSSSRSGSAVAGILG